MTAARARSAGRWACVAAAAALLATVSGCRLGGTPAVSVHAVFSDVDNLVVGAPVQLADVPVGHVTAIGLDGSRARVTMSIDRAASVPADVTAELDQTSILGTWFVNLVVPRHPDGPIADGQTITRTRVVPGVEQVIGAGSQVFGAVSSTEFAQIVAAGGRGFDGQAASLRSLLDDLSAVTAGYAHHTAQIRTTIQSLDTLGSSLAPDAGQDAQAISNLATTVTALAQESGQFNALLQSLDTLSVQGKSILSTYSPQITDQLDALRAVAGQLATHQQDLAELLRYLPLHDSTLSSVTRNDYLQVLENLIVCGIPGGGSDSSPAFTCGGGGGSGSGGS